MMFVYVSIFSFSLLSFIDMSACPVFIVVCLFCILYFICILCSYCYLFGVLNLMIKPDYNISWLERYRSALQISTAVLYYEIWQIGTLHSYEAGKCAILSFWAIILVVCTMISTVEEHVQSLENAPFRMLVQQSGTCYQMIYVELQR